MSNIIIDIAANICRIFFVLILPIWLTGYLYRIHKMKPPKLGYRIETFVMMRIMSWFAVLLLIGPAGLVFRYCFDWPLPFESYIFWAVIYVFWIIICFYIWYLWTSKWTLRMNVLWIPWTAMIVGQITFGLILMSVEKLFKMSIYNIPF